MPSTKSRREPMLRLDPELNRTLCKMNIQNNPAFIDDDINPRFPQPVDDHNRVVVDNPSEDNPRRQHPTPHPQEYYRGNVNITDSDVALVLHPLPQGHTFVVTSSVMQMLIARGLFPGLSSEDPYTQIAKVRSVCKSCVWRPDSNMDVIGLRVFPLLLTGEAAIWFTELPYISIYTWNQLRHVFLGRYYPVSKKLNHKYWVNNFAAVPEEFSQ